MTINIEIAKGEMSSDEFFGYIDEGTEKVLLWIEREKASTGTAVNEESITSLIKIYLSQNNLLPSSARDPEGRIKLIYQAIYENLCPNNKQNKRRKSEEPTKKPLLEKK